MSSTSDDPLSAKLAAANTWITERAAVVLVPGLLFIAVRLLLDLAGRVHWTLELILSLALSVVLALILLGIKGPALERMRARHPLRVIVGVFLFVLLLSVTVFSAFSLLLSRWQPGSYSGAAITPGKFADFYFWHFAEALPGLKLMSTYEIPPPLTTHGPAAATLVLLFRGVVIVRLLAAARSWFRIQRSRGSSQPSEAAA